MRFLLVLVGIAALLLIAAMAFGLVDFDQTKPMVVQAPQFKADVARINVGTENKTIAVPDISIEKPANTAAPAQ